MKSLVFSTVVMVALAAPAYAQAINYDSMNREGFGDVGRLLQSMTPEQRAAIYQQAQRQQQEMQKLTPKQQQELLQQLHDTAGRIDFSKVDPRKFDGTNAKSVSGTQADINKFQQR